MKRLVKIVDYNPQWPTLFENEKRLILHAIGNNVVRIEHVGSTAVIGLGAKPIIDITVAIKNLKEAYKCIGPLESIGYEYVPEYEESIPERRYFHKGRPARAQHYHIHMVTLSSNFWKRHLLFRNYLRTHPEVAQDYYELKKRLAREYGSDRTGYTEAKTLFIESAVAKAKKNERANASERRI
ncbi:MAG: GrpB family protein [Candidatus Bathyarchaeota archaeon]|nr:GrpB family protein [Candidatus Bathyarchaeota archaeon]